MTNMTMPAAANDNFSGAQAASARAFYLALNQGLSNQPEPPRAFVERHLAQARAVPPGLPSDPALLDSWSQRHIVEVGKAYQHYLARRHGGAARSYFPTRAAALHFLRASAPTKLADGAWLYGLVPRWRDAAFHGLIRTYLEELGDGVADKNHVAIYQQLLAAHGCEEWTGLPDENFVQGAIQLALAAEADNFLPELLGYNLGYEQLPLHLLVTAFELNELGIDPYYFTLHVTVDNGSNGHARKAIAAVREIMARADDPAAFYRRVQDGYRLNELGASTTSIIAGFDIDAELKRMLAAKSVVGKDMHSDYCVIEGRKISDWLQDPAQIGAFVDALQRAGWFERGRDAQSSRFWGLVSGPRAEMFGVFSAYELQLLRDWIEHAPDGVTAVGKREPTYRARQRNLRGLAANGAERPNAPRGIIRHWTGAANDSGDATDALRQLEQDVAASEGKEHAMALLGAAISPSRHHTPVGMMATRMFAQLLDA